MCECVAENIPYSRRDKNNGYSGGEVEGTDNEREADHMRPQREVDERLRPTECYENSPDEVDTADELADGESGLGWIEVIHTDGVMAMP